MLSLFPDLTSPALNGSATPSWLKALPLLSVDLMLRPKHSLSCEVLNSVSSIPQALHMQVMNGRCAFSYLLGQRNFGTPPLGSTCLWLEQYNTKQGFPEPRANCLQYQVLSGLLVFIPLAYHWWLDVSDLAVARYLSPRSPALLGTLAFSTPQSSWCLVWLASLFPPCMGLQIKGSKTYLFRKRPFTKLVLTGPHSVQSTLCWHISWAGATFQVPCSCSRIGSLFCVLCSWTGFERTWSQRTLQVTSQPQLAHQSCHCGST